VDVLGSAHGFTRSHQLALDVRRFGGGRAVAEAMERANIVLNMNLLPWDDPRRVGDPSGVRIGFQEVTRRGFEAGDVEELCELVLDVLLRRSDPSEVAPKATALRARFPTVRYGFSSVEEALSKLGG
jgi:glycine hydroxymethyltransferase